MNVTNTCLEPNLNSSFGVFELFMFDFTKFISISASSQYVLKKSNYGVYSLAISDFARAYSSNSKSVCQFNDKVNTKQQEMINAAGQVRFTTKLYQGDPHQGAESQS